jgi:4-alpha-glucanotransferase
MVEWMRNERSAGVLLHITSLPGPYGIGDLGPEAYKFADQLSGSGQRYWQLLPVNPVHEGDFSPYSAIASMAGNTLFISPDQLVADGLLTVEEVNAYKLSPEESVDYESAVRIKAALLERAYQAFRKQPDHPFHDAFATYCTHAADWLDDYATYRALCAHYGNKPWQEWSKAHRRRDCVLTSEQRSMLEREKWWQFLFATQWKALKDYCNGLGILLFGDLPIYVHPSAADVWAHPEIFEVDDKGHMTGIAGVPPDYFNDKGQLWQMPVYNWQQLKASNYAWWIKRMKRNLEWFDVIRLDHFRAFSAYWRVEPGSDTAIEGEWIAGPGNDFFDTLGEALEGLPFVAEDLGMIDDAVRKLRSDYGIPGMRVLQFAFGDDMATSEHIPHQLERNIVLLTGTHDNNTTKGWYKEEADKSVRRNLKKYTGQKVNPDKAHLVLSRMAYASVANTVILPMQDVLGMPGSARMNVPSSVGGNWRWRMQEGAFSKKLMKRLKKWVARYGRAVKSEVDGQGKDDTATADIHIIVGEQQQDS